jgi:hypothetical protein
LKLSSGKSGGSFFLSFFFIFTLFMSKDYKITSQGSLGILALGHVGLRLWRQEIEKAKQEQTKQSDSKNDQKQKK